MMTASLSEVFGRVNAEGNVDILYSDDGYPVSSLNVANLYPIGSTLSVHHEHPEEITVTLADALRIGIEIE